MKRKRRRRISGAIYLRQRPTSPGIVHARTEKEKWGASITLAPALIAAINLIVQLLDK